MTQLGLASRWLACSFAVVLAASCGKEREYSPAGMPAGNSGEAGAADELTGGTGNETGGTAGVGGGQGTTDGGESASGSCTGVICDTPPMSDCESPTKFVAYDKTGSCDEGKCTYVARDVSCTCENHECTTDPCLGIKCATPPEPNCKDEQTLTEYEPNGACDTGSCSYGSADQKCDFGCTDGKCNADPCLGVTCSTPPASACVDSATFKAYDKIGTCSEGACSYAAQEIACLCKSNACTTDPCIGVTCNSPPATVCKNATTLVKYAASGTCSGGSCSYQATEMGCDFGCANAACKPDPCAGVTCNTQKAPICKDTTTVTSYAATGTCSAGSCSYQATDTGCGTNKLCGGAGVCAVCKTDAACGGTCAACSGGTPKCKDSGTSSKCVGCLKDGDCSGATPICNLSTNVCQARPSCNALGKTCGPSGTADCCASTVVPGDSTNTFLRDNDPMLPAKVGSFRLDTYEVTVGRFRNFVTAYTQGMTADNAGKNPNNPLDPGWNSDWNIDLPANATALKAALNSCADLHTWTDVKGANESLPINCVNWLEANAFCIWDGGRVPTSLEWNYAAAGGIKQRAYPWNGSALGCSYANFLGAPNNEPCVGKPNRVGSESPLGDGFWGHADLAGNVAEWTQDVSAFPPPATCDNCAYLTGASSFSARVTRGAGFSGYGTNITTSAREPENGTVHLVYGGIRCARLP
jgi:formylglycine-generating enzyme